MRKRFATLITLLTGAGLTLAAFAPGAQASFGFAPGSVEAATTNQNGTAATLAGFHPYGYATGFELNALPPNGSGEIFPEGGNVRDFKDQLPPGLIGDVTAIPKCTEAQLEVEAEHTECPEGSVVGVAKLRLSTETRFTPVYNMVPPHGTPAEFGFNVVGFAVNHLLFSVGGKSERYAITARLEQISQLNPVIGSTVTIWGVPADPSHDAERGACMGFFGPSGGNCPAEAPERALLSLPTSCAGSLTTTLSADSWEAPGTFVSASASTSGMSGCEGLQFEPSLSVTPEVSSADSPTGLSVDLRVPQSSLANPSVPREADLKDARVTLPEGISVNTSSADGLQGCSEAQIQIDNAEPAECPAASKIGTVEVTTPLLDHPLPGAVYVATPHQNPFGSLLAIYIAVDDPASGVVLKLPGHVETGPGGQLTTTFAENPQLPFEDFKLNFFGGSRAALKTPALCGGYETTSDLTPWSSPEAPDAHPSSSFAVESGPNGGACATSEAALSNSPSFEAGTRFPIAGAFSPFVLHLHREDGSQRFARIDTVLPPGMVGRLAGLSYCPEAAIAAAEHRSGKEEQASPSCPASSQVGTVTVGAGAGANPIYVSGHAYLTGPNGAFPGAPLGLAIVTPAVAGPYDLGTVVVRAGLYVNPETAQITVKSDPIPTELEGIPLDVRSIAFDADRPQFTLNPTSCDPMSVGGSETSTLGGVAALSDRFQVGACNGLGFRPRLALSLKGKTRRAAHPALRAVLTMPQGGANIARAQVALPHSEFLDQGHIRTVCTRVQFAEGEGHGEHCPKGSIYGYAKAWSPLLEKPLQGPVYLRSSSHKLPDLVAALNGQIFVALDGRIDSIRGGIRNSFEMVPDAPVSKFVLEMQGGAKGLLVNSTDICAGVNRATADFDAQNGKISDSNPVLKTKCGGGAGRHGRRHR